MAGEPKSFWQWVYEISHLGCMASALFVAGGVLSLFVAKPEMRFFALMAIAISFAVAIVCGILFRIASRKLGR